MAIVDDWTVPSFLDLDVDDLYTEAVHDGMCSDLLYLYNTIYNDTGRRILPRRIAEVVLGAPANFMLFSSIPQTYRNLRVALSLRGTDAGKNVVVYARFDLDLSAAYAVQSLICDGAGSSVARLSSQTEMSWLRAPAAGGFANEYGSVQVWIPSYGSLDLRRRSWTAFGSGANGTLGTVTLEMASGIWANSAPLTTIEIFPSAGQWATGSVATLYGEP